jgi:Holliday junction resolvase-like predicted endonuclease
MVDIGESLIGSYFKYVMGCKIVVYNVHYDNEQGEIDVVAFGEQGQKVYLCEVITHIRGTLYGKGYDETIKRIRNKIERAVRFAEQEFSGRTYEFQVWTPVVPSGLAKKLKEEELYFRNKGINLVIVLNEEYSYKIEQLKNEARKRTHSTDEPAFRLLQILEHIKPVDNKEMKS